MITRTIAYTDYDGNQRKEKVYFNLTEFEATEIAMEMPDGIVEEINEGDKTTTALHLVEKLGGKGVIDFIKKIVLKSYGLKSQDGRRIIKSDEISKEFSETPMFSQLMIELMTNETAASDFINAVIPPDLAGALQKNASQNANK